jgi:nucleotide-binding universal stress UspA family protein
MSYKDILVFLDNGESNKPRVETALALALAHDARLVGIAYDIDVPRHIAALIPGFSVEQQRKASRLISQDLVDQFLSHAEQAGVTAEATIMKCRGSKAAGKLAAYARNFDISILRQAHRNNQQSEWDAAVSEEVLISSGRPVLYIPYVGAQTIPPKKALIAWDCSRTSTRAIHDAMPLLEKVDKTIVLIVDEDPKMVEKKTRRCKVMVDHLQRHGIKAEIKFASSEGNDVASTILNSLVDNGADLLVMGGYGSSRLREHILGGVTKTILEIMTVPVCMSN